MTRRAVCLVFGFFLFVFTILGSLFYTHNKAMREITLVDSDEIYIQWPIKKPDQSGYYPVFSFASYHLHITPAGVPVEGIIKQNALPFTASTSFTWNLKNLALAEKCISRLFCGKPSEDEIKELEVLLREGRRRCELHTGHIYSFPEVILPKPESAMKPIADFSFLPLLNTPRYD